MTTEIVENANTVLRYLNNHVSDNVNSILEDVLDDARQVESNIERMATKLQHLGRREAVGAIAGGTGALTDNAGLEADAGQDAIRLLKEEDFIQQCGRGRGRAIILLTNEFLDTTEIEETEQTAPAEEAIEEPDLDDEAEMPAEVGPHTLLPRLLREASDEYRAVQHELRRQHRMIRERDEEIARLRERMNNELTTTWT